MMIKDYSWIGWSLVVSIFFIMFFGMFWMMSISNAQYTIRIDMDEETRDYLIAHNYCVYNNKTITFMGECEYLPYNSRGKE